MKKIICTILICCLSGVIFAQEDKKFSGWKHSSTEHFNFIYEDSSLITVKEYAKIADNAWNDVAKIYSMPQNKTDVYVTDRTNTVNAFTYFAPIEIGMFTTPCDISDFCYRDDWRKLFFTHELIHVANASFENKSDLASKMVGPWFNNLEIALTTPAWALEGLTTVLETELTDGGRGRSPYFELKYKAPTLDNSFIPFEEIGMEKKMPVGQIYVMGYLILRSIADRFGISALADIERNKSFSCDYNKSIYNVTGLQTKDFYRDIKIALAKKYADERKIPEGKIVSERTDRTNTFNPAYIFTDGSYIALKTDDKDTKVIKWDAKENKESVLFQNNIINSRSVAVDNEMNIYSIISEVRNDRFPGVQVQNAIYKWNKNSGLKKITKKKSFAALTISQDGKLLIAMMQTGLNYSLVKVDVATGEETILLSQEGIDFLQPSLNTDGTEIAFLKSTGKRAIVCSAKIDDIKNYSQIANYDGEIVDPILPHFNSDGKLSYGCNTRGRLEVFEVEENGQSVPVVSDPIGAMWATKIPQGILYLSYASTGYVLKVKPIDQWKNIPDFNGPSMPGQRICFGDLLDDYNNFTPYPETKERVDYEEYNKKVLELGIKNSNEYSQTVIPIKHRPQETLEKVNNLPEPTGELSKEKKFFNKFIPVFYLPSCNSVTGNGIEYLGLGYNLIWLNSKLQQSFGCGAVGFNYYSEFDNFDFELLQEFPIGPMEFDFLLSKTFSSNIENNNFEFKETNLLMAGFIIPLFTKYVYKNSTDIYFNISQYCGLNRTSSEVIKIDSDVPFVFQSVTDVGINFSFAREFKNNHVGKFDMNLNALGAISASNKVFCPGALFGAKYSQGSEWFKMYLGVTSRYLNFGEEFIIGGNNILYGGKQITNNYPLNSVLNCGVELSDLFLDAIDLNLEVEKLIPADEKFNFTIDNSFCSKLGIGFEAARIKFEAGAKFGFDFIPEIDIGYDFYCNFKFNGFNFGL